jgi:hypothetical protein
LAAASDKVPLPVRTILLKQFFPLSKSHFRLSKYDFLLSKYDFHPQYFKQSLAVSIFAILLDLRSYLRPLQFQYHQ